MSEWLIQACKNLDNISLFKFADSVFQQNFKKYHENLTIFDFDNTLATTECQIYVINNGETKTLSSQEYATYTPMEGDKFDFRDFKACVNPKPIFENLIKLIKLYLKHGNNSVIILTARSPHSIPPILDYLSNYGLHNIKIKGVGSSNPDSKAQYIRNLLLKNPHIKRINFIDDAPENIHAVKRLKNDPQIKHVEIHTKLFV